MRYTSLALAAALLLTSPAAAYAVAGETPTETAPAKVTRTVTWFGYYTPGDKQSTNSWNGLAHAYPQFLLKSNLSLSCGQRYITQTDVMVGTEGELDSITADGKLTAGEDSHVTKSWTVTFHEEPACPTSTPTPSSTTTSASPSSTGTTEPSSSPSSTPSASESPKPSTTSTVAPTTSTPSPSAPSTPSPATTTSASKPASSPTSAPSSPAQPAATMLPYTGASETVVLITIALLCVAAGVLLTLISKKD